MYKNKHKIIPKKEDTTKYGEFVCSSHHWIPVEKQKDRARELANITKDNTNEKEEKNKN